MHTKIQGNYEPRLVSEYVIQNYPGAIVFFDIPLGPIPPDAPRAPTGQYLAGITRTSRPRADAVVIHEDTLYVVEGKILDVSLGAGKLPMYEKLIPQTPELSDYKDLPRKMVLIASNPAQWSAQEALNNGIELVIFQPPWVMEYMDYRNTYWTAAARNDRERRKAILKAHGYDQIPKTRG